MKSKKCPMKCEECRLPSFYDESKQPQECIFDHILSMLEQWQHIRSLHLPTLTRLSRQLDSSITSQDTNSLMGNIIIFHDAGKLTSFYKEGKTEPRHEFISAYLFYDYLRLHSYTDDLKLLLTGVVLLHHEPILLGQLERSEEPHLTSTELWRQMEEIKTWQYLEGIKSFLSHFLNGAYQPKEPGNPEEICSFLSDTILYLRHAGGFEEKARRRLILGAWLSPLVVLDYFSAKENRPQDRKDSLFWQKAKIEVMTS